jgi:hypothetical protein
MNLMTEISPTIFIGMYMIQMAFLGFMWNRMDKRFDRLENKIDNLFEKYGK